MMSGTAIRLGEIINKNILRIINCYAEKQIKEKSSEPDVKLIRPGSGDFLLFLLN